MLLAIAAVCFAQMAPEIGIPTRVQTLENTVAVLQTQLEQLLSRVEIAETEAQLLRAKDDVASRQFTYNRDFDACIAYGSSIAHNTTSFQAQLNKVVDVFCPDSEFEGWRAWFAGAIAGSVITNRAGLLAKYDTLCGIQFVNVSRHIVTNTIVTPFIGADGRQYAEFNGSISQWDFQSTMPNVFSDLVKNLPVLPQDHSAGWNMNLGWYNNLYLKQENGNWCMKRFDAYTSNLEIFPVVSIGQSFQLFMN